jgi:hypothetical protein
MRYFKTRTTTQSKVEKALSEFELESYYWHLHDDIRANPEPWMEIWYEIEELLDITAEHMLLHN